MDSDDTLHLGNIIKQTGDFGNFQIFMVVYGTLGILMLNWSMMTMTYTAAVPEWRCYTSAIGQNETGSWNASNVCHINGTSCERIEFLGDMKTAVSEWNLVCDRKWISQTITTIQMSGLLVGGLICGHISDGIGRKPTMWLAFIIVGAFNLVSYFSVNWVMFAIMRFAIGFGCACSMSASISMEYIRNKWRVYLFAIPGWAFGASLMALFCWKIHDWHWIHIVIAAISGAYILTWPLIPESFRWLVAHGRFKEAEKAIRYVAKINKKPVPPLTNLKNAIEYEQKEAEKVKTLRIYTVLDLFRTSHIRKTTILFSLIWLFSAYSYYGIAFAVQELSGNLYMNMFLLSIVDFPSNILNIIFNYWGGRRWTCVGFYIVGGIFALAVGILKNIDADVSGSTINILALFAKLCISAAWDLNTIWSFEAFPTVVRNIGGGFISSVSRVGSMIAPQIITLSQDIRGLLYILSGIVCVLSSILCAFLRETKDRDLDDMIHSHNATNTDKTFEKGNADIGETTKEKLPVTEKI